MKKHEIFVSPSGSDRNPGTIELPLATIEAARNLARKYKDHEQVFVNIRGGEYFVDHTISFGEQDSGKPGMPVTYRAYKNEKPVITGAKRINKDRICKVTDEAVLSRIIDKKARGKVMQIDLCDFSEYICPLTAQNQTPIEIYQNECALELARYPKRNTTNVASYAPFAFIYRYGVVGKRCDMYLDDETMGRIAMWDKTVFDDLWTYGYYVHDWEFARLKICAVNYKSKCVSTKDTSTWMPSKSTDTLPYKKRMFFANVLDELSAPGEYYVDREKAIAYFIPVADVEKSEFYIPVFCESIFSIEPRCTSDIVFKGLCIKYTKGHIFILNDTKRIAIEDCEISHGYDRAIELRRVFGVTIRGCHIYDFGKGGIGSEFCGERYKLAGANILIEHCDIHDVTRVEHCYRGCINLMWETSGVVVRHNKLHSSPHLLISMIAVTDITIEDNEIYNAIQDGDDSGVIYWQGDNANVGITIRGNYFHGWGNDYAHWGNACLYADGGCSADIYNNVFADSPFGSEKPEFIVIKAHSESFANIHNNIFAVGQHYFKIGTWDREGCFGIAEVGPSLFGAATRNHCFENRRNFAYLCNAGFFCEFWQDKYKGTAWAPMWDLVTFDKVAKVQNYKKELEAKGEPEEIIYAKAVLLADALGWNHKLPDGTVYEGDYWDCIKTKFKKYYDEAVAECEGKGELELLNRLHTLTLEMYWFKRLVPTITTRAYDNICVGVNPCYITEDGKVDLGYYRAESEVIIPDDMKAFSDDKYNLSDEAIAYIKEKMPTFVPFSIENAGTGKRR